MSEARVGRLLVASLHQAIADVLPARLEFYENWLNVSGMREGTIGLGPLFAVLSFLRGEGGTYQTITRRLASRMAIRARSDAGIARITARSIDESPSKVHCAAYSPARWVTSVYG